VLADFNHIEQVVAFLNRMRRRFPKVKHLHFESPAGSRSNRASKTLGLIAGTMISWATALGIQLHYYSRAEAKKGVLGISGRKGNVSKSDLKKDVQKVVKSRWATLRVIENNRTQNAMEHICDAAGLVFAAEVRGDI
jgi:hypothetical protein